ncbi:MAG: hypothetical protein MUO51_15195 [Woeseiaceae bacterium]|nr:hypothetical protein [Woeseiaceae bacterium]
MKAGLLISTVTRGLMAAAVGLLAIVALQIAFPAKLPKVTAADFASTAILDIETPPAYVPAAFDTYAAILERPLLYADRKLPAPPPEKVLVETPPEPLRLALEGVALGGGARVALLRDQTNNQIIQLLEGMAHNGWTLAAIHSDKAVFSRDAEVAELVLEIQPRRR